MKIAAEIIATTASAPPPFPFFSAAPLGGRSTWISGAVFATSCERAFLILRRLPFAFLFVFSFLSKLEEEIGGTWSKFCEEIGGKLRIGLDPFFLTES